MTHFVWLRAKGENGPYRIKWMGYEDGDGLLELLALLKSLADQVYAIRMLEPSRAAAEHAQKTLPQSGHCRKGYVQCGPKCACVVPAAGVGFAQLSRCTVLFRAGYHVAQLRLEDPIDGVLAAEDLAAEKAVWRSLSGDWVVTLGKQSTVSGTDAALPAVECSVNSFSRLLWGVTSASSLAISDGMKAPASLLESLDGVFTANPNPGWDF